VKQLILTPSFNSDAMWINSSFVISLVDVGVVAVVGLDVDRGHGLGCLCLGYPSP